MRQAQFQIIFVLEKVYFMWNYSFFNSTGSENGNDAVCNHDVILNAVLVWLSEFSLVIVIVVFLQKISAIDLVS